MQAVQSGSGRKARARWRSSLLAAALMVGPAMALAQEAAPAPAQAAPAATSAAPAPSAPAPSSAAPSIPAPSVPALSVPADSTAATLAPDTAVAPEAPAPSTTVAEADLPHDLSPWGMFMAADWIVKSVMTLLILASVVTWTVWLAKTLEMIAARARARSGLAKISDARRLVDLAPSVAQGSSPVSRLAEAALREIDRSAEAGADLSDGVKERVQLRLQRIEAQAARRAGRGTGILATIGSVAPFVGLFGTVWGIMNSFVGISQAHTTNLAVVAPGIAEALLATACGLVAAIPAVVIYNIFARSVTGYRAILTDASAEILRLVSRDLDSTARPLRYAAE
ncbi:outer membrane transport energization protein ExbB [Faunimonas pinastri]|uniref:Biopolymer transport protein ExbB n=1 Tax=Faunimonas pinastri TaxID=1855383 RepID=A0A1H9PC23_9HYPH|nr:tonB-system energizer ExbB [Faunimonas pinastri]SER45720.1 outer membrane transport energization protein ExbB [Faunimonas pinastri]